VIVVPAVVLSMLFVVQFGLAYHARQVLAGATQDGAAAAGRADSTPADGAALADQLIVAAGGSLLESHTTAAVTDGETVTVTAHAKVIGLIPFFGAIAVHASSSAKLESFDPQGGP
jgi:Flp pilus assembly protein TadG